MTSASASASASISVGPRATTTTTTTRRTGKKHRCNNNNATIITTACVVLVVLICIIDIRKDGSYMSSLVLLSSSSSSSSKTALSSTSSSQQSEQQALAGAGGGGGGGTSSSRTALLGSSSSEEEQEQEQEKENDLKENDDTSGIIDEKDVTPSSHHPATTARTTTTITATTNENDLLQLQQPLPPVHYNSTWLGDTWIPSSHGYKLYSATELADYYSSQQQQQQQQHHSVLIMGDSTARRFYATWYEVLKLGSSSSSSSEVEGHRHDIRTEEIDSSSIININKNNKITEICNQTVGHTNQTFLLCRTMPGGGSTRTEDEPNRRRRFDLINTKQAHCFKGLGELLKPPSPSRHDADAGADASNLRQNFTTSGDTSATNGPSGGGDLWPDLVSGKYTLVVISIGPWELQQEPACGRGRLNNTEALLKTFQDYIEEYSKNNDNGSNTNSNSHTNPLPRIVWRTWIGPGSTRGSYQQREASHKHADAINHKIKRRIDGWQRDAYRDRHRHRDGNNYDDSSIQAVSYVDFGHIMRPRTWPQDVRLAGDIDMHIGLGGRLAMIQAMTNHLVEQDRQKQLGIPPWMAKHYDENSDESDCWIASPFRRPEYCLSREELQAAHDEILDLDVPEPPLSPEEQDVYEKDKERFCPSCIWNGKTNCDDRLSYIVHRYGDVPRNAHLHSLLEGTPSCVKPGY